MNHDVHQLFSHWRLEDYLRERIQRETEAIDQMAKEEFIAASDQEIAARCEARLLIDPLVLFEEQATMAEGETDVDVSGDVLRGTHQATGPVFVKGIEVRVSIPFAGHRDLWKAYPNSRPSSAVHGALLSARGISSGLVILVAKQATDEPIENIRSSLERSRKLLRQYVDSIHNEIETFNATLTDPIKQAIKSRRDRLAIHQSVVKMLGIPLHRKSDVPAFEPIRMERSIVRPLSPAPTARSVDPKPEYGIKDSDYEYILKIIRHETRTFETTPSTYQKLDEEDLRNVILAHLNGHFEGGASGETFRRSGKTDIKIEFETRAAFVGECKVWNGQAELGKAIDQLLGYLIWRDSKAALIVFNKHVAGFSDLLDKAAETLRRHPRFMKEIASNQPGEWRFLMSSQEDPARLVTVQLFVVNLYVAASP